MSREFWGTILLSIAASGWFTVAFEQGPRWKRFLSNFCGITMTVLAADAWTRPRKVRK